MPKRVTEFFVIDIFIALDSIKRHTYDIKTVERLACDEMLAGFVVVNWRSLERL